jgi:hypothetical protein
MAADALQFGNQHPNALHPLRHLNAEQLLDRQGEGEAIGLGVEIVHALDQRDHLLPLLLLGGLLDAGMEIANRGRHGHHRFAIELQHQPQHAMRAGVLRPHVDGHRLGSDVCHCVLLRTGHRGTEGSEDDTEKIPPKFLHALLCVSASRWPLRRLYPSSINSHHR